MKKLIVSVLIALSLIVTGCAYNGIFEDEDSDYMLRKNYPKPSRPIYQAQ